MTEQHGISESPQLPTPSERHRRPLTDRDRTFLEALSNGWSVRHAAVHAGRHWRRFYTLRDRDEAFAKEWQEAVEAGVDVLEQEAYRRAVEGVDEPVYQGGEMVGTVRRYSDRLLEFLIRGRRPSVYRDTAGLDARVSIVLESAFGNGAPIRGDVVDGEAREVPHELTETQKHKR